MMALTVYLLRGNPTVEPIEGITPWENALISNNNDEDNKCRPGSRIC